MSDITGYHHRLSLLRSALLVHNLDTILIYGDRKSPGFIRWLLGVPSRSGGTYVACSKETCVVFEIAYRTADLPADMALDVIQVGDEDLYPEILLARLGSTKRIGLLGPLPASHIIALQNTELIDLSKLMPEVLTTKTEHEIDALRALAADTTSSLKDLSKHITCGCSEEQIARRLLHSFVDCGATLAFPLSLVSGGRLKRSTVGNPTDRILRSGDAILVDCGLLRDGLISDCTRMFFVGDSPLAQHYDALCTAHKNVMAELAPGVVLQTIVDLYHHHLNLAGLPDSTLEELDLGHGIGFELHEYPMLVRPSTKNVMLTPGMLLTLEPEITVAGFKLRVEDMLAVHATGLEVLT